MEVDVMEILYFGKYTYDHMGMIFVAIYCVIFLIVGMANGKFRGTLTTNNELSLTGLVRAMGRSLWIPLIFLGLGLLPMFHFGQCGDPVPNYCEDAETRDDIEGCVEADDCMGVVIRDSRNDTDWIGTYYNAYGKGVVQFQIFTAVILALALGLGGTALCLWGLRALWKKILPLARKIPIRW